jgi:hypothetical protein
MHARPGVDFLMEMERLELAVRAENASGPVDQGINGAAGGFVQDPAPSRDGEA